MSDLAPEGVPAGEPAAAEPAEPVWAGPSQDEWSQLSGAVQYLAGLEQQRASLYQPQDANQGGGQLDPFADTFGDQLRGLIREELTPYQQFQQETQLAAAEENAMDMLHDLAQRDGEFDLKMARMRADALLPQMQQQYGWGPKAAEAALEKAAAEQREYEQKMYGDAVAKYSNQIATLAGAPGEPGSSYTVGTQVRTMPDYTKGGRVTDRFFGPSAG